MTHLASDTPPPSRWIGRLSVMGLFFIALGASCSAQEDSSSGARPPTAAAVRSGATGGIRETALPWTFPRPTAAAAAAPVASRRVERVTVSLTTRCPARTGWLPAAAAARGSGGRLERRCRYGRDCWRVWGCGSNDRWQRWCSERGRHGRNEWCSRGASAKGLPPGETPVFACHIRREATSSLVRRCEVAGSKASGEPCTSSGDCLPGLGCVGEENVGRCRPFCCDTETSCDDDSFCAARPLRDDADPTLGQLSVPVCAPADNCSLGEPYPCDDTDPNAGCVCKEGTACTVVRADGTTSCVPPGTGTAGQECPCAAGHICSQASGRCVRICKLGAADSECGTGRCQAPANFPEGFGVCVASDVDAGD